MVSFFPPALLGPSWPCGCGCKEERPNLRLWGVWSLRSAKHFSGCRAGRQGGGESLKGRQAGRWASTASSASSLRASLSDP